MCVAGDTRATLALACCVSHLVDVEPCRLSRCGFWDPYLDALEPRPNRRRGFVELLRVQSCDPVFQRCDAGVVRCRDCSLCAPEVFRIFGCLANHSVRGVFAHSCSSSVACGTTDDMRQRELNCVPSATLSVSICGSSTILDCAWNAGLVWILCVRLEN